MQRANGFTLIELAVVVAVVAIIAMIAFPSYTAAMQKSRRTEGKTLLQTIMAAEERYYTNFNRYTNDTGTSGLGVATDSEPGRYYALTKVSLSEDAQSVSLVVAPQNAQQSDRCGNLALDSIGRRGASMGETADCW